MKRHQALFIVISILLENADRVTTFQIHLMLHFSIKSNKTCTQMIPCSFFTSPTEHFSLNGNETTSVPT